MYGISAPEFSLVVVDMTAEECGGMRPAAVRVVRQSTAAGSYRRRPEWQNLCKIFTNGDWTATNKNYSRNLPLICIVFPSRYDRAQNA